MIQIKLPRKQTVFAIGISLVLCSPFAMAGDFRVGAALGYGGAGATATQSVGGASTQVQRSESPGTISLSIDYLLSDSWMIGFEHCRGFRIAPFSSGASFTGFYGRWYFLTPAPSVQRQAPGDESPQIFIKNFSFFAGIASGIAFANIVRDDDEVPDLQGSAAYVGIKLGADYPLAPGLILRPEISSYQNLTSATVNPVSLSYFSFSVGLSLML